MPYTIAFLIYSIILSSITFILLTRREQEIPHFYKWWDELRKTRCTTTLHTITRRTF